MVEAEDVVQEAMIRAWRGAASCESADPLPWALSITRREAWRRFARRPREEPVGVPDPEHQTLDESDRADDRLTVQAALDRLDPEDRRLLVLRYRDDLTQSAVAKALALPEGTTKVRLHRLRRRLRSELETLHE